MGEVIPIAPDNESSKNKDMINGFSPDDQISSFDEDVLSEIENRLDLEDDSMAVTRRAGEKVELDKADLPLDLELEPPPQETAPKIQVDLAGDEEPAPQIDLTKPDEVSKEQLHKRRIKLAALGSIALTVLVSAGLGLWFGLAKPSEKVLPPDKPYFFRGKVPDPKEALRLNLEPFLVPLLKSDGGMILQVRVSLEVMDELSKESLTQKSRLLRDVIYRVLRDRPAEEVREARAKRLLQAQIKTEVNHALQGSLVFQVFFTDFVITG